jgi:hypothetical protein
MRDVVFEVYVIGVRTTKAYIRGVSKSINDTIVTS